VVRLENVSKTYHGKAGTVAAVSDVTLTVEAGEFVSVQGPSGCGKTTLLLVAGGLLRPDSGRVALDGHDPYALPPEERARMRADAIGFVFQRFHLMPYLTVLDNVLAASMARPSEGARERAMALLEHVGLGARLRHVPAELSTGERQRVALARAILNEPRVLLADEPTGNLDPASGDTVLKYLADFTDGGGAVLLVTHDARAAEYAGRIVRMADGRLVDA
jgi:ABC-type lipoprotein export system ATPase subunit